jgi:hypothetical protein
LNARCTVDVMRHVTFAGNLGGDVRGELAALIGDG